MSNYRNLSLLTSILENRIDKITKAQSSKSSEFFVILSILFSKNSEDLDDFEKMLAELDE